MSQSRQSPFTPSRYGRRQSLYPSPTASYSASVLSPGPSHAGLPGLAEKPYISRSGHDDTEREGQQYDVCSSYSARRSSLTSLHKAQGGHGQGGGSTKAHPHKWWKLGPSSIASTTPRRNSNSSVKLIPPRITKTQYPENV